MKNPLIVVILFLDKILKENTITAKRHITKE